MLRVAVRDVLGLSRATATQLLLDTVKNRVAVGAHPNSAQVLATSSLWRFVVLVTTGPSKRLLVDVTEDEAHSTTSI